MECWAVAKQTICYICLSCRSQSISQLRLVNSVTIHNSYVVVCLGVRMCDLLGYIWYKMQIHYTIWVLHPTFASLLWCRQWPNSGVNLALLRPVLASSQRLPEEHVSRMTDGVLNTHWTSAVGDQKPWAWVDLLGVYQVTLAHDHEHKLRLILSCFDLLGPVGWHDWECWLKDSSGCFFQLFLDLGTTTLQLHQKQVGD